MPPSGTTPRRIAGRHVGEQREQTLPAQAAPVDVEQIEHETRREALGEQRAGTPVPDDARGVQVVLDEAGIRLLRRPQDADPLERDTAAGGVEHGPHGVADLVVGVGRRHDRDDAFRRGTGVDDGLAAQEDRVVLDEVDVDPLAERIDELDARGRRGRPADAPRRGLGRRHRPWSRDVSPRRRGRPRRTTTSSRRPVTARLTRTASCARLEDEREPSRGSRPGEADLVVNAAEGDDGGGMTPTSRNTPGCASRTWAMASSTSDDDIGERPDAARVGPAISSASRFSVTMSTPTIPRARPRAPARHHPARVGRYDHGDGRQRIVTLGGTDGARQFGEGVGRPDG